ncbi:MAG TPA: FAD/NAD(P)-binding oxidoreductase [Candidatus Polarisedimenticolaceae bacterium]|nr:FAD/NAD(P)-binding oxidoreductase [Candidatus Polarisedimenticolaceae bacterium]
MSSGTTTVVLGGGFGGIATARRLRERLPPEHEVRLIAKSRSFQVGATKTWVMLGRTEPDRVTRPLDALRALGIDVLHAEVERIEPETRTVATAAGTFRADYLVLATGADLDLGAVPGLAGSAETFYTREGSVRLRDILRRFDRGKLVILVPRVPFQCPPGPYEAAMLLQAEFRRRGMQHRTSIEVHTVEHAPMTTAGPAMGAFILERLAERGIGFHPRRAVREVDGSRKRIRMDGGEEVAYDLLIAVPPHSAARVARESGLTHQAGWIPVDARTLELAGSPAPGRIFAIGDVTSVPLPGRFAADAPLVLPKAGVFAEREGEVVAARIAAHALGREPGETFDGKGYCYIEIDEKRAVRGEGSFFELPHPAMIAREPDTTQSQEKKTWAETWLTSHLPLPS